MVALFPQFFFICSDFDFFLNVMFIVGSFERGSS